MPTNSLTNKSHELGQVTQTTSSSHISNHHPTHPNNTTVNFSPSPSNESIPNEKDRSLYISSDSTLDDKEVPDITSDDSEKSIEEGPKIGYFQLYRFATTWDWICVFLGSLCAVVQGVGQPMLSIFLGDFVSQLQPSIPLPQQIEVVRQIVIKFTAVGAAMFICGYGQMCFFTLSAENQTKRIRALYLHSILRQDMAWHDTGKRSQSLNSRLSSDSQLIFDGLADKVGQVIMNFSMVITGFAIAFAYGWKMTLVLFSAVPMMAVCAALMAKFATETSADGQDAYARAGAIAEQAISSIRTVVAFGGQSRELAKYSSELDNAYSSGAKKAWITGTGSGSFMLILFMSYSLAFWFGAHQVKGGHLSSGAVPTVLFATVIAAFSIGNIGPHVVVFARARAAAHIIFKTIDRVPEIDAFDPSGIKPEKFNGHIVVKDVNFTYPSRPNIPILQNMNIEVKPGQTVALVGHSGSGKSTIVGLVERFYNPISGSITLDGHELKDINLRHLRDTIGLVSQEPVLFNTTIKQNILYGTRKDQAPPTDKDIEEACRLANAHDFISKLPQKYNTLVGEKGALLSGGQKQRIAIARALIKNPSILLLDEATSALDTESERIVQAALDNAATGRSTIVIAHRLSTIMDADVIYVMDKGVVLESGTHESLMTSGGVYAELVAKQQLKTGGTDIESPDTQQDQGLESKESHEQGHIIISETPLDERTTGRSSRQLNTFLRRGSATSHHTGKRSEKSVDFGEAEDPEAMFARQRWEEKRRLKQTKAPILRTMKYARDNLGVALIAAAFSVFQGTTFPLFSQIFSKALVALSTSSVNPNFTQETDRFSLYFLLLAFYSFLAFGIGTLTFMIIGERISRVMRHHSFKIILSQEMAFFDRPENSTGALASRLATDSQQMFDMVSVAVQTAVASTATVALGLGLAFAATWRMTLIVMAFMPVMGLAQYLELMALTGFGEKTRKAYERSGQVAGEAIANIRTVASLAKEDAFEARYAEVTVEPHRFAINKALYASFGFALSQGVAFWSYSVGFYSGYRLVESGYISWGQVMDCMFSIVFTSMALGHITVELPRYAKGKLSAINIYELLDKESTIDAEKSGRTLSRDQVSGSMGLEKVHFRYPTRPDIPIFDNVDVNIHPSHTVALVGPSGCGKSTIIALLERWYDVLGGRAVVEGFDIRDLQLNNIREHMALVGQEPVLFDMSIKDNILYGLPNSNGSIEQVEEAAKQANIHNFIMSLPNGYDTMAGDKGSQLSGGQKQRIAIARALIRQPKVLLLDEATSALDSESEKLVQEALDRARHGRTTIVIAHRLSTIQDADLILVVKDGNIVESGKHYELISQGGVYSELCKKQSL